MERAEAYRWRERRRWQWDAWLTHCLISAWTKAPSVQELMQPFEPQTVDAEAAMEALFEGNDPASKLALLDKIYAAQPKRSVPY